ncbi:MAG TPA: hypothetical protein VIV60_11165, partial [Polyangiaceae bacterium]
MEKKETKSSALGLTNSTEVAGAQPTPPPSFGLPNFGVAALDQHLNSSRPQSLQEYGIPPLGGTTGTVSRGSNALPPVGISPLGMNQPKADKGLAPATNRVLTPVSPRPPSAAKNVVSLGSAPPIKGIVVAPSVPDCDEDGWDLGESTAASMAAAPGNPTAMVTEPTATASQTQNSTLVSASDTTESPSGAKAEVTTPTAKVDASAEDVPLALPQMPASPAPAVSDPLPAANAISGSNELDEDSELLALIAAAKARADEMPPPPPPLLTSTPPAASDAPLASHVESAAEELDEDAELLALIAAAKARADEM